MADNYIEKRYEAYQAQKAAWEKNRKAAARRKAVAKRIFVTGGAEGIGRAIVKAFSAAGHRVAFCDRNAEAGTRTAQETGALFLEADVRNVAALEEVMQQLFHTWDDIDVIINNAGVSDFSPITDTPVEEFDRILQINLRPVFITARKLALHRKNLEVPNKFGRIVNICSTRYLMSEPGSEGYAASKGGIYSLTHALAISLSEWHITVNAISPGWIQNCDYDSLRPIDHEQHPSRRVGKPEDIARMCLFLCQPENDFINGENIVIDGGMTRKMIYEE